MKIQRAIKILANTKIISEPDHKLGGEKMVCASNFESPHINEAFQEIVRFYVSVEIEHICPHLVKIGNKIYWTKQLRREIPRGTLFTCPHCHDIVTIPKCEEK